MAATSSSSPKKDPPSPAALAAAASAAAAATGSPSLSPSPSPSPDRSPSPIPLPASLPPPPHSSVAAASGSRRLAAPIWTHEETLALIDAYRDKWYALRRGNLRASHWQEVADDVARRCPSGPSPPKSSVQCRHKVEKLRKRYRSERHKSLQLDPSLAPASSWVYFRKMDAMEHGGGAVSGPRRPSASASPSPAPPRPPSDDDEEEEEEDDDDDYDGRRGTGGGSNTRSMHRLMANGRGAIGELRFTIPKAVRSKVSRADDRPAPSPSMNPNPTTRFFKGYTGSRPAMEEMRRKMEKKRRKRRLEMESSAVREMVSALRMLGDGFLRMEQKKMEMAREMEKVRMEMELKRTELILDSQRRIVDAFLKGFSGKKRTKVSPED
ncbi:Alcohol dehydrogenase transcription factor Myb/SANT-like [Musa troglodytarum]|uniref:Alcohol dehydrogenase transcription factor Myb/SANT-like n=1 Tax=Musa troglodytarum TaxID=320322 RepID=A0A9E7EJH5_9LILI|nr:Alcohol dehydrogenase transcription factor Myb/SANT-like [Musa troglodytarum]